MKLSFFNSPTPRKFGYEPRFIHDKIVPNSEISFSKYKHKRKNLIPFKYGVGFLFLFIMTIILVFLFSDNITKILFQLFDYV